MTGLLTAAVFAATFTRPLERVMTMDPAFSQSAYDSRAIQLVYETPLAIDYVARPYRLVAGCCEMPEVSADGRTYVLTLRRPSLTAADLARTLEHLGDRSLASPNGWIVKDVESVEAIDKCRVRIVLRRRVRYFPWLLAMSPCAVLDAKGEGTGPYRLARWTKNHEMVFVASNLQPSTSILKPDFDTIRYLVVDDVSTQWLMFLRGEVDFLGEVSRDNWDSVVDAKGRLVPELAARGVRLVSSPTLEVMYVGVNLRDPVLGPNRALRQALNCAFDFPAWERFYNQGIIECDGPVPPGVAERLTTPFAYRYDPEKARRLLVEAGYPGGIDPKTGRRLRLTMSIGRASRESREAGELMASFYAKVGIRLELDFLTWDAFLQAVNDGRVQLYRMGWVGDYPDAQNFLQLFYGPNRAPGVNHSNFANAEYDAAYEREDYAKCQEIVREECPWIFTHFTTAHSLVGPRVDNYIPTDFPYGIERHFRLR